MLSNADIRRVVIVLLAMTTLISTGCVNLDGQTLSTKAPIKKTPEAMLKATKSKRDSFVNRLKNALPSRPTRPQIAELVASDDPTRLENKTKELGPDLYIAAARLSERNGRYDAALEQYNMALKSDGRNRNALIGLARLQHRGGNMDAAIRIYRDALNIYRNDAVIMNDLGLCYARNQQLNEAISVLQSATQAAPDREMYMNNLAAALVEANRAGEAVAHLTQIHGPAVANYNVGFLLDRAGNKSEAGDYLNRALAINPNMQKARSLLASNTPQVSSLSQGIPNRRQYEIPVTQQRAQELQAPQNLQRPQGDISPVIPPESPPPHLQKPSNRFGPFGFVPKRNVPDTHQLVTFAEEACDRDTSTELTSTEQVQLFPLRRPRSQRGGAFMPPFPPN